MRPIVPILCLSALALVACQKADPVDPAANDIAAVDEPAAPPTVPATAVTTDFAGPDKSPLGKVTASDSPGGLMLTLAGAALPAGVHGIHLHSVGKCEGPKFESAGSHWNPANKQHGTDNPAGPHLGDLPNVTVPQGGTLNQVLTVKGVTLAQLKDADGSALVIHAMADDNKTDPSGNSGDRIACAVLAPPQ